MKLYIIGNGFDIAHEIKSSYHDFAKYVSEHDPMLGIYLGECYSNTDLWNDFEMALGEINAKQLYDTEESEHLQGSDYDESDLHSASDSLLYKSQYINDNLVTFFEDWVQQIGISHARKIRKIRKKNTIYFSFNYTETLEQIYEIPESQVLHIHGKRNKPIFGHTAQKCNLYEPENERWIITDDADDAAKELFDSTVKPVKGIVTQHDYYFNSLSPVRSVCVMGHSLNEIDAPYFKKIISVINPMTCWTVYFYKPKEKTIFSNRLQSWGISKSKIKLYRFD